MPDVLIETTTEMAVALSFAAGREVVEAVCKNLIGARMKKSGMQWTIDGA